MEGLITFVVIFLLASLQYWPIGTFFYQITKRAPSIHYVQAERPSEQQITREIAASWMTLLTSSLILLWPFFWAPTELKLYDQIETYGIIWYLVSIALLFVLHDTYFYWTHRWLHHPRLFRFHATHHSRSPSTWTAYSFHPLEALLQNMFMIAALFLMPMHWSVYYGYSLIFLVHNFFDHCGLELYPMILRRGITGQVLQNPTGHNWHHAHLTGNYALYFKHWDRWFSSLR